MADYSDLVLKVLPSISSVSPSKDKPSGYSHSPSFLSFSSPCYGYSYPKMNTDSVTEEEDPFSSLPTVYGGPMMWLKRRALLLAETPSTLSVSTSKPCSSAPNPTKESLSCEHSELTTILETNEDLSVHSFCTMIESSSYSYRSVSHSSISESDMSTVLCYDDEEFSSVQVSDAFQHTTIPDESLPSLPSAIQPFTNPTQRDLDYSLPSTIDSSAIPSAPMYDRSVLSDRRDMTEMERSHCCTFM